MTQKIPRWADPKISQELPKIREVGENDTVEFKQVLPEQAHKLAKEIAAMASSGGGRIFIGIHDNGQLCGIDADDGKKRDEMGERVHGIIRTVKPTPKDPNILFAVESEFTVLVIDIPKQDEPVFYSNHIPYIRDKKRSRPAEPDEVKELVWKHPSSEFKREQEKLKLQKEKAAQERHDKMMRSLQENTERTIKSIKKDTEVSINRILN